MNLSKTIFGTLLLILLCVNSRAQELITNESVLQMKQLEFDDFMIADKINTSDVKFDASISALSELKKAGVSSDIISLIMEKSKQNTKSRTGIYYMADDGALKMVHATVFSGTSEDAVANRLVSGFIPKMKKARLSSSQSNNIINADSPEFTFIFDPSSSQADNMQTDQGGGGYMDWWFRTATSPNEFVLVKLDVNEKRNLRELITGKSNLVSNNDGIDPKYAINFEIEEIEGNKFKVTPTDLEEGEYAFMYQGLVPNGRANQSVFDFSIR
ncbi:hypothetical protein [Pricia sp.]|uniref:hypothetical protein n=1 Tax=Pricia sp. TaxID=2268138 RepID=UPI00359420D2